MDLGLKGKKAVVLGGTRGIGRAIVETLIADGVHVALCARNAAQVDETVATLKANWEPPSTGWSAAAANAG